MNILQVKKYYLPNPILIIEQAKFNYYPLRKFFVKKKDWSSNKKQFEALKDLKPAEYEQQKKLTEDIFPKELQNNEI